MLTSAVGTDAVVKKLQKLDKNCLISVYIHMQNMNCVSPAVFV
jgi:hypothetical protein